MTLPLHLHQRESHDCGVASVAMAANVSYEEAKDAFDVLGLHVKKRGRQPYSSNFSNVQDALGRLGCETKMLRFCSWDTIDGPTIVKVDNGHPRNWHWVYATRTMPWGLVVLDPGLLDPCIEHPPMDTYCVHLTHFKPKGNMLVVERPKSMMVGRRHSQLPARSMVPVVASPIARTRHATGCVGMERMARAAR